MIAECKESTPIPFMLNPPPLPAVPAVAAAWDACRRISNCMRQCDLPYTRWRQVSRAPHR